MCKRYDEQIYWLNLRPIVILLRSIGWKSMDLTTIDYEIQAIEMTEVALRSRHVVAASGSDLCNQVAPLDWRRPT